MKKITIAVLFVILIFSILAQKKINIFKSNLSISNLLISQIDSMKFNNNSQIDIFKNDNSIDNYNISVIDSITFSDSIPQELPVVSTTQATSISYTTATSGLIIKSIGGSSISEKGICWSINENPTINDNKITSNLETTSISVPMSGLNSGTMIYVRAYAVNATGVGYGENISFKTLSYSLPSVSTVSATYNYSTNKVTCVVNVASNGGCALTERGVCWSTSQNPTTNDSKYASGTSVGQFYALMSSLNLNATYYVRSYATNCAGTAYGNQLTVKALMGKVTYTMGFDSITYPEPYRLIKAAVDSACYYYNRYTPFVHNIWIAYSPGVPTAEASYHGQVAFGSNTTYMWVGTAMHEFAHYFGSGTTTVWKGKIVSNVWTGTVASSLLTTSTGETLKGDTQHFWPYGINYKSEITALGGQTAQQNGLILHTKLVKAMLVDDCGLPTSW